MIFRKIAETRANSVATPSEDIVAAFGGIPSYSGKTVTITNSMELAPVFRAITLLSGAVGSLPLPVYRRGTNPDGSPLSEAVSHTSRPWQLLHDKPNELMAADELWSITQGHLASWGNAFLWKERGPDNRIANLWPIDPARVLVGRDTNLQPIYMIQTYAATPPGSPFIQQGTEIVTDNVDILHIRALGRDGLVGYSPVQLARQMLGGMMAQQEFEGRLWANDATPGVALIHPNKLSPEATENLRKLWDRRHKGPSKARSTAVLGEGVQIHNMTMPLEDAQFVENAQMKRTDVALMFGLPPYMLAAEVGSSLTYSTSETQSLDFVKWSLMPWLRRIENAVSWDQDLMPQNWYAKFDTSELLRGTTNERFLAYSIAPHLLVDEVREAEDMPPLPDGKGQVLAKTIAPPRGTTIPVQDEPLGDQPDPSQGAEPGDSPQTDEQTQIGPVK